MVAWIATAAAHGAIHRVLSIIDGDAASGFERFELVGVRGSERLVNPETHMQPDLHEAFQSIVMTDAGELPIPS